MLGNIYVYINFCNSRLLAFCWYKASPDVSEAEIRRLKMSIVWQLQAISVCMFPAALSGYIVVLWSQNAKTSLFFHFLPSQWGAASAVTGGRSQDEICGEKALVEFITGVCKRWRFWKVVLQPDEEVTANVAPRVKWQAASQRIGLRWYLAPTQIHYEVGVKLEAQTLGGTSMHRWGGWWGFPHYKEEYARLQIISDASSCPEMF